MSRLIKDFGYSEKLRDEVFVDAEDIENFSKMEPFSDTFSVRISRNFNEERFDFNIKIRAFEDKPGIEIMAFGHTREPKLYTGSVIVDEIRLVNEIYNVIVSDAYSVDDFNNIKQIIAEAFSSTVQPQLVADGYWFFDPEKNEWTQHMVPIIHQEENS